MRTVIFIIYSHINACCAIYLSLCFRISNMFFGNPSLLKFRKKYRQLQTKLSVNIPAHLFKKFKTAIAPNEPNLCVIYINHSLLLTSNRQLVSLIQNGTVFLWCEIKMTANLHFWWSLLKSNLQAAKYRGALFCSLIKGEEVIARLKVLIYHISRLVIDRKYARINDSRCSTIYDILHTITHSSEHLFI